MKKKLNFIFIFQRKLLVLILMTTLLSTVKLRRNINERIFTIKPKLGLTPWNFDLRRYHYQSPVNIRSRLVQDLWCEPDNPLIFFAKYNPRAKYLVNNSGHGGIIFFFLI